MKTDSLKSFLIKNKVNAQIIDLGVSMPTASSAATQLGVPLGSIFKSLVLKPKDSDDLCLVVLPGDRKLDKKALEKLLGLKKLGFASKQLVLESTGYPAGGTPPIGHRTPIKVIVDQEVLSYEKGYGGGGKHELLLEITPEELIKFSNAQVASIAQRMEEKKLKQILIDDLFVDVPLEDIKLDDDFRDVLGLDSLSFMELRVQCEKVFNIEITDEEYIPENFSNLRQVIALVQSKTCVKN